MTTRFALALVLLTVPALPQGGEPPAATSARSGDAESTFYRAFYLYRGERRHDQALALYREFLAAAPRSRFASRAVNDAAAILTRTGKADEAQKLRDEHAARLSKPDEPTDAPTDAPPDQPRSDRSGDRGDLKMTDEQKASLRERLAEAEASLVEAEKSGDERTVRRLTRQIESAKRQLESGVAPSGRGNRGGRSQRVRLNFAEMDSAKIAEQLEQLETSQARRLERMRSNGQEERAKKIEESWAGMKKLLDDGKTAEAQKAYDELMSSLGRRRG